jgi:putative ABC transport system permease protein
MHSLFQDLRYAIRTLAKQPGFTAVALITLALGIGANTAIFSVVYTVLLKPLPFGQPEALVQLWEARPDRGWNRAGGTHANFWDLKDMNRTFEGVGAMWWGSVNWSGLSYPERLSAGRVSAGFFRILRVQPVLGRTFVPGEDDPGQDNQVVLLANDFWRTRFGADPNIVGQSLTLDGEGYMVVGVLPAGEPWLNYHDVFLPLVREPDANRGSFELAMIGRLAPGVSIEAARSDLESVARRLEEAYPAENAGMGFTVAPSSEWGADNTIRRALWVLLGAVGFLLLIACVNLVNLLLAKSTTRQRETALRTALGAGRGRIVRQMLTESLLLGLMGAGLGVLIGWSAINVVKALDPGGIPRLGEIVLNKWVLGFTLITGILTGIVSGLVPALQLPRRGITTTLHAGGRSVAGSRSQRRLRSAFVAIEVALSLTLLVGAVLLLRSFNELLNVERGFESEGRLIAAVNTTDGYDGERCRQLIEQVLSRVKAIPRVQSAAAVSTRPIVGGSTGLGFASAEQPDPEGGVPWASWRLITPDYFRTMGIPLLKGRAFSSQDQMEREKPLPTIVSKRLADELWPGEDPIGRRIILWRGQDDVPGDVIGVVGNMRERGLESDPTLAVYFPYLGRNWSPIQFVVHTAGDPLAFAPTLRTILSDLDPTLPLSDIASMDTVVSDSLSARRFNMFLLAVFAGVALLLALAGIYGVQSYSVARRTSEIGIRVALGASGRAVVRQMMNQGMQPALLGIVLGLLGALGLSRLMSGLLFGIEPGDPLTYVVVALVLTSAALISCFLPALRALRVDPVTALREE